MMVVLDVRWECFTCGVYSKMKMGVGNDVLLYYSIRPVNKVVPWTGFIQDDSARVGPFLVFM